MHWAVWRSYHWRVERFEPPRPFSLNCLIQRGLAQLSMGNDVMLNLRAAAPVPMNEEWNVLCDLWTEVDLCAVCIVQLGSLRYSALRVLGKCTVSPRRVCVVWWCGGVWECCVWCVWCCVVLCGVVWCCVVLCGVGRVVRCCAVLCGVVRCVCVS